MHPRKVALTVRAPVNEATTQSTPNQRQSMTSALAWESKIATGSPPLWSVRQNPSARAEMCQQMGQLMAQRSIDFSGPEFLQSWIKPNMTVLEISATDGRAHAIVPAYP
jgi:hypothetical protein